MEIETVDLSDLITDSVVNPEDNSGNEEFIHNYGQNDPGFDIATMPADGLDYEINLSEESLSQFSSDSPDIQTIVCESRQEPHILQTKIKNKVVPCSRRTSKNKSNANQAYCDASEDKQSDEYRLRRERNNKFVRACREKERRRNNEVEHRVTQLLNENKQLLQKVDALTSELVVYKNLFSSVGVPIPAEIDRILNNPVNMHDVGSDE